RLANGEIDDIAPKLAVIMIGTNNRNSTVDELAEGIEAVCNTVLTKLPETKVLLLAIFPRDDLGPVYRTKIGQVNERIALLADNKRLFYMDIGYLFLDSSGNVRKDLFYDLLHPGAAGYQIWAESIEPFLVKSAL
ncbi:MAG: GDSL family lipase, partial [Verrucomicrobia bacterium]|nr:GDSL family lipase [Verrucomicrobiota bacterium]